MRKLKITKWALVFTLCFIQIQVKAQTSNTDLKQEIGLRMPNLHNFGFIYKKQKEEDRYLRIRLISANFSLNNPPDAIVITSTLAASIGKEQRKLIKDQFYFVYGWEMITSFSGRIFSANNTNLVNMMFSPVFGLVLGFQYNINEKFALNIETIPSLGLDIQYDSDTKLRFNGVNANFNTNNVALSLLYRLRK